MDPADLNPTESDRVRRRDRKRVTAMVVNGGNLRRQLEAQRAREWKRRQDRDPDPANAPGGTGELPQ